MRQFLWCALWVTLIALMVFFVTGDDVHEYLGLGFAAITLAHLYKARYWFPAIAQAPRRLADPATQVALASLAVAAIAFISGVLISHYIAPELCPRAWRAALRHVHLASTFWLFALVMVHAGWHWRTLVPWQLFGRFPVALRGIGAVVLALATLAGCKSIVDLELPRYLSLRPAYYRFDADIADAVWVLAFVLASVAIAVAGALSETFKRKAL